MTETAHFDRYHTCIESLASIFDKKYRRNGFSGPYERHSFEIWQDKARENLIEDLKLNEFIASIGHCRISSETTEDVEIEEGISREKVLLSIEGWTEIPMYVLRPESPKGIFICLAGHHSTGKLVTSGNLICATTVELTEKYGAYFGLELARRGYIAICPDTIGFGERREIAEQGDSPEKFQASSCRELANAAISLGFSLAGIMVYEGMRIADYAKAAFGENMPLYAIGFSGGAMQTLYLSAADKRIDGAIISGYFYGFKDSLLYMNTNCPCNYVPGIFRDFDMMDIAGLIAPRSLAIQSAREDHLNGKSGFMNVLTQIDGANRMYSIYDKTIYHDVRDGGHAFHMEGLDAMLKHIEI